MGFTQSQTVFIALREKAGVQNNIIICSLFHCSRAIVERWKQLWTILIALALTCHLLSGALERCQRRRSSAKQCRRLSSTIIFLTRDPMTLVLASGEEEKHRW